MYAEWTMLIILLQVPIFPLTAGALFSPNLDLSHSDELCENPSRAGETQRALFFVVRPGWRPRWTCGRSGSFLPSGFSNARALGVSASKLGRHAREVALVTGNHSL